jgi:hypothetical protein
MGCPPTGPDVGPAVARIIVATAAFVTPILSHESVTAVDPLP